MMTNRKQMLTAAALSLLTFGAAAAGSRNFNFPYDKEVTACVAEVKERANYNDARRVQHRIVKERLSDLGYVFTINTSVFTNSTEIATREYTSYCVARGDKKPLRFEINELSDAERQR